MAKELLFKLNGTDYASAPVKLERKKIYGWTDIVATDPIVMANGGTPYRAFLEGRVDGDRYALILRLTNMELKSI